MTCVRNKNINKMMTYNLVQTKVCHGLTICTSYLLPNLLNVVSFCIQTKK